MKILLVIIPIIFLVTAQAFAQDATQITVSTDRQSYSAGDTITLSGKLINPGDANTAVLQVYNTANVLMQIGVIHIAPDGTYTTQVKAEGSGWSSNGVYTIKVLYVSPPANAVASTTISFSTTPQAQQPTVPQQNIPQQTTPQQTTPPQTTPQQTVPQNTQQQTQVPQPAQKTQPAVQVPFWAKDAARKWHDGIIPNTEFGKVIQYLVASGLVKPNQNITPQDTFENTPSWVKEPAVWWSQGLISDTDFAETIQFLLNSYIIKP